MIACPADRTRLQQALNCIENWSRDWQLQFSIDKCQLLQLGYTDSNIFYHLGTSVLAPVTNNKDLGFPLEYTLKPSLHIYYIVRKANTRAKLILKCFHSRDPAVLIEAFNMYVRPLLEYGISEWNPCSIGHINRIESEQRSFTYKVLLKFKMSYNDELRYNDRLKLFDSERFEIRRLRTDLTELFKIIKGFSKLTLLNLIPFSKNTHTHGHR